MSTRTGFPRMDWDTGFLADPKFQHLRELLPDPIRFGYAGFCYLRLAADAWRTCERNPIEKVIRGVEDWAVTALETADLIDERHTVLEVSFDKWVGAALEVRQVWKEQKRRARSHAESAGLQVSHDPVRVGTVDTVGKVDTEGVQGEGEVLAFLAQHGAAIRPDAPLGRRLLGLVERRGAEAVIAEATEMAKVEPVMSDRQWVLGLENGLEAIPSGRKTVEEAVAEEADARKEARSQQVYDRMVAHRLDWYRQTGKWDPSWGPTPEGSAA